mgnify:CR=1 FL=1
MTHALTRVRARYARPVARYARSKKIAHFVRVRVTRALPPRYAPRHLTGSSRLASREGAPVCERPALGRHVASC